MRELALFAGAGGGILGGNLLGWRTVCAVEWEPYPASVLCARQNDGLLPPFPVWDDVQTFDGKPWRGVVDVVSGGFPCQDISAAGSGAGIDGARSGMWKHMARIVGEVLPRWGMTRNGHVLAHPTAERPISATGFGLWPTPTCQDNIQAVGQFTAKTGTTLGYAARYWTTPSATDGQRGGTITENMTGSSLTQQINTPEKWPTPSAMIVDAKSSVVKLSGRTPNHNRASTDDRLDYTVERKSFQPGQQTPPMRLNPEWVEWLMGWPQGWTDLKPLGMDRFREWQQQHSLC